MIVASVLMSRRMLWLISEVVLVVVVLGTKFGSVSKTFFWLIPVLAEEGHVGGRMFVRFQFGLLLVQSQRVRQNRFETREGVVA